MSLPLYQVDAFSDRPFAGNPAGVCILSADDPRASDASWMQNVAREMNLSETAFLRPRSDGFDLRWFTPAMEVDLCGHATLASAHVLYERGVLPAGEEARFYTASGLLTAVRRGEWLELDFPAEPAEPAEAPAALREALGARALFVGRNRLDYLVEVESEEAVRSLRPDLARLRTLRERGVMVTSRARFRNSGVKPGFAGVKPGFAGVALSRSPRDYDFVSRFFAPGAGIDEDPVTGSAHCCLGPYWGGRLGKSELTGYQASARGGLVRVRLAGPRVKLGGRAVTVIQGMLEA
jgi:PhzF family phenazine biosynthesis protein